MTRFNSFILTMLIGAFAITGTSEAGPWPQKKRSGFYKLGFGFVRATTFIEPNGNRVSIPTLADYTFSFYGEHGITDRLTAIAYLPLVQRLTLNRQIGKETGAVFFEGDEKTGIADADIGLRFGLAQFGGTVISAELSLGIPIGDHTQQSGLWTGDGEFNQRISVGIGHSFYPAPAFVAVQAGVNNRTKGFSDEFRFDAEAGYTFGGKLTAIAKLRGLEPFRNGDDNVTGGTGGLFANNQRYLAYGIEMAYSITEEIGFSLSVEGATRGQSILSAPAYATGLYLKL